MTFTMAFRCSLGISLLLPLPLPTLIYLFFLFYSFFFVLFGYELVCEWLVPITMYGDENKWLNRCPG